MKQRYELQEGSEEVLIKDNETGEVLNDKEVLLRILDTLDAIKNQAA